ncbi:MAG: flagellar assembly protein FliW [Oscillospiraceae bacterium]|jgi:flagellar assembly factor FliW|nr:flagellar assembly protein FliW [Oscillospiraceae bacterium]
MVKIITRDFGEIEVSEECIFTFPAGLFAFEEARRFALFSPFSKNDAPWSAVYPKWLQSIDGIAPCFIVFDPLLIDGDYEVKLERNEESLLELKEDSKVRFLVIATIPEDFKKATVNMKAPIIVNVDAGLAAQVILPQSYEFRLPIYAEQSERKAGAV